MPDAMVDGCSVQVMDRGSRICVDVVHLASGAEVSMIGPAAEKDSMLQHALRRIAEHVAVRTG